MVLIFALAGMAATALTVFNKAQRTNPAATEMVVGNIYQSASVLMAIVGGFVGMLDALRGISRAIASVNAPSKPHPKLFGVTPAVDVTPPA